ncbi:CHAT domain-containing protein, partial [Tricladium varicosporioides]
MDFEQVSNSFGGTIFPEEYRTDFQSVEEQLQALASTVTESSSVNERAVLLLLQGIDAAMRGELAFAERYFDNLQILTEELPDRHWRRRCVNYQFYLLSLKRLSPVLRFRPDSDNDSGIRKELQLEIFEKRQQLANESTVSVSQDWPALEKLEGDVILNNSRFVNDLWMYAYRSHPNYPHEPLANSTSCNMWATIFNSHEPYPTEVLKAATSLGLHKTVGYLKRLIVEYWIGGNSEKASSMLSDMYRTYLERNDIIGAANCKLIQGDKVLSLPFTNPLALNLIPLDRGLSWDNEVWDATEAQFPLRKVSGVDIDYQTAYDLFTLGGSKRGQAAVHLRRGCVDHIEAVAAGHAGRLIESASLYRSAGLHFREASHLFQRDSVNLHLVYAHQLLLDISVGNHTDVLDRASQIGEWGMNAQNNAVSQFLGLLMLRFGRMIFLASGEATVEHVKAMLLCACARICFNSLGDSLLELQAVVAHAMLHQRLGNTRLASALLAEGHNILPTALQCFDQLIQAMPNGDTRETLQMMRYNRLENFNRASRAIFGPGASPFSIPASPMQFAFAEILRLFSQSLEAVNSDYYQTMKNRRRALIVDADVDTSENYLREFLTRWSGSTTGFVAETALACMKVGIFHYLGEFNKASQVLSKTIPIIYGGENDSGQMLPQLQSMISKDQYTSQRLLAEESIGLCFLAKDWQVGQRVMEYIRNIFPGYPNGISPHDDIWQLLVWVGCIDEHNGRLAQAFDWYLQALRLVETRRHQVSDLDTRRDMFATIHSGELFSGLARISWQFALAGHLAESRMPQTQTWRDQVLLYLEQGRSRALVDLLMTEKGMEEDEHDKLQEWATHEYQMRQLDEASKLPLEQRDKIIKELATDLGTEKGNISIVREELERRSLGLASVLDGANSNPSMNALYSCIPADAACIHINLSRDGMLLLCINSTGIQHVYQNEIVDIEIERTILRFLWLFRQNRKELPEAETCMSLLKTLSVWIIDPVVTFIRDRKHVIFVPSRSFHKFPFSALLLNQKPLFLQKEVSQIPSLTTLSYLAQKTRSYNELVTTVVVKSDQNDENDKEKLLPMAGMEAINIAQIHGCVPQNAGSLSNKEFGILYESSDIVHISTHGIQSGESAWQSSITLRENFRVHDLAKSRSKAAMVVFGSCVSGLGEDTIGNDMLGFSHAVIASGALVFLGGLWDVDDLASMFLMVFFHRGIAERKSNVTLAESWRRAQTQLYELDTPTAKAVLEELRDGWDRAEKKEQVPAEISRQPRDSIGYLIEDIEWLKIDFTHPQYWAPFILVGHGGLVI